MQRKSVHLKVVLLGDTGVGKSSLVLRYVANTFKPDSTPTIGGSSFITAKKMLAGDFEIKFNIWDTAGQEKFNTLGKMYYRDADAAILIYDVMNPESFANLKHWYSKLLDNASQDTIKIVVGNKEDMVQSQRVSDEDALEYAISVGAELKKTSAKTNYGVEQLFREIAIQYLPELKNKKPKPKSIILTQRPLQQPKSKKCCNN